MKLAALISGGKDSIFAIAKVIEQGHSVVVLVAIESENKESYMFHVPNVKLTKLQAKAMNLPIIYKKTKGEKEKELDDLKNAIKFAKEKYNIGGVVSGAMFSNYQKDRVDKLCNELGLKSVAPLWHIDSENELNELLKSGFEIIITAVACQGLDESWLGKRITQKEVKQLLSMQAAKKISAVGEGGEFETLVIDCPMFKKKIKILDAKKIMTGEFSGYLHITKTILVDKQL